MSHKRTHSSLRKKSMDYVEREALLRKERTQRTVSERDNTWVRACLFHKRLNTDPIIYMSDFVYSLELCDKNESKIDTYLKVLSVAIPFSTGSGVLVRSCDPSLGAIFVARIRRIICRSFTMKKS